MTSKRSVHFANEKEEGCTKKLDLSDLHDLHETLAIAKNRLRQIEREQREKKGKKACKYQDIVKCQICVYEPVEVVFLPCMHSICCAYCAPAFEFCPKFRCTEIIEKMYSSRLKKNLAVVGIFET